MATAWRKRWLSMKRNGTKHVTSCVNTRSEEVKGFCQNIQGLLTTGVPAIFGTHAPGCCSFGCSLGCIQAGQPQGTDTTEPWIWKQSQSCQQHKHAYQLEEFPALRFEQRESVQTPRQCNTGVSTPQSESSHLYTWRESCFITHIQSLGLVLHS